MAEHDEDDEMVLGHNLYLNLENQVSIQNYLMLVVKSVHKDPWHKGNNHVIKDLIIFQVRENEDLVGVELEERIKCNLLYMVC